MRRVGIGNERVQTPTSVGWPAPSKNDWNGVAAMGSVVIRDVWTTTYERARDVNQYYSRTRASIGDLCSLYVAHS